ncbi:semaphorin 5A-like protein [Saccoglossus kowalevskii]|uniref:Semaphorin 5A-like protein n=1 Tax=Saccoglossus kowalevskii TaxID=10224 RepID=D2XNK8_SACKO|nr:semaphorin 5A-like protein [Saccoglossus kowalevskii]ADB22638.1 semaphorin 5A-like protein [Saccoglossus kowalevskii]
MCMSIELVLANGIIGRLETPDCGNRTEHSLKDKHNAVEWEADDTAVEECRIKGKSQNDCRNFIRVLLPWNQSLFVCGTYAFAPQCSWRPIPNFVSSYEIGSYIYFYFRETAVEYMNCGKTIYSRVARVCKNDSGGHFLLEDNWTTFTKARLNCSLPGEFPFYFDELQGTFYIEEENLTYAVFTTVKNSIHGSAVCVYDTKNIHDTFTGDFKYQENAQSAWVKINNPEPDFQCDTMGPDYGKPQQTVRKLEDARKYQLMDDAVQPTQAVPLYYEQKHDERFTDIVVDIVRGKHQTFHVMFIGTESGIIKKVSKPIGKTDSCVVEEIHPFDDGDLQPVKNIKLLSSQGALYVGSESGIMKISVHRCHTYSSKRRCLDAMDPYCGWDSKLGSLGQCVTYDESVNIAHWHQDMSSCPILHGIPVNGRFGNWSDWERCNKMHGDDTPCMCRKRQCNNPLPECGGKECKGDYIQVINCTVHGGWTKWSAWSGCSKTCGVEAVKTHQRSCTNPSPMYGGRECVGLDIEQMSCEYTPCPSVGEWSAWMDWTECSSKCNGGAQVRSRTCINGGQCPGSDIQYRACRQSPCLEEKKSSPWTVWSVFNKTDDGYYERRQKYTFKARVPIPQDLYYAGTKDEVRYCPNLNNPCVPPEERILSLNGTWSSWSPWSLCSTSCGSCSGLQLRERICQHPIDGSPVSDCEGAAWDSRVCKKQKCVVDAVMSCWSEWSECTVTCGGGIQERLRTCEYQPQGGGKMCENNTLEVKECNIQRCPGTDGWENWTKWSSCGPNNLQYRYRKCLVTFPPQGVCEGPQDDTKRCQYNAIPEMSYVSQCDDDRGKVHYSYLIISIFVTAFIVSLITFIIMMCYHKHKHITNQPTDDTYSEEYKELKFKEGIPNKGLRISVASSNGSNYYIPYLQYSSNMTVNQAEKKRSSYISSNCETL